MAGGVVQYEGYRHPLQKGKGLKNKRKAVKAAERRKADAKQRERDEAKLRRESQDFAWGDEG